MTTPRPRPVRGSLHAAARVGLAVGIPLALLLGAAGVSRAFDAASGWSAGEVLTAADLNALLARVNGLATALGSQAATTDALVTAVGSQAVTTDSLVTTVGSQAAHTEALATAVASQAAATDAVAATAAAATAEVNALSARVSALTAQLAEATARVSALEADNAAGPPGALFQTTISDTTTDLGVQLNALMAQHRNVLVWLARGTEADPRVYRWNTVVDLRPYLHLHVIGAGYKNSAQDLGVKILMDGVNTWAHPLDSPPNLTRRAPVRLIARDRSSFMLEGVRVSESGNSTLHLTQDCDRAALFTGGDGARVALFQIRIESTENVVNVWGPGQAHVRFGHTFFDQMPGSVRTIVPVAVHRGWCFAGGGAVVATKTIHTHLGPGVAWDVSYVGTTNLQYLE